MYKIKIKFNVRKFFKRQINDFKQAKYLKLGLIVFALSGLFSYFIVQNHIYAFNNEALITRELNNAKGREITDPVKKREIMKYATNFPKEGKWQSNNNLTIIKNGKAIQSQSMRAYSFPIVFNFLEKPRTKLRGRRINHKLDKTWKQDMTLYNLQEKEQEQDQYVMDHNISRAPNDDLLDVIPDNSHFEYHTPGEWIYGHIPFTFYRMHFKRMNIDDKQVNYYLNNYEPNIYLQPLDALTVKNIHVFKSKISKNMYIINFDIKCNDFNKKYIFPASELLNLKTKKVVCGKYIVASGLYDSHFGSYHCLTYVFNFLGDKLI